MTVTHFVTQVTHVSIHFGVNKRRRKKSRENFSENVVSDLTKKLLLEKIGKKFKNKRKKPLNIYNLQRILGTKLVLLVDF